MVVRLGKRIAFPPPERADYRGLLAVGGDLSLDRLEEAYRHGIFPWFSEYDPILWWCPPVRCVLDTDGVKIARSLRQVIRQGRFEVTFDRAFGRVIESCAVLRAEGTWITDEMRCAYTALHEKRGIAHSVEAWHEGELAGGLYGVSIGRMFFGESMFVRESNASKVCLVALAERLRSWGFELIDCQITNEHLLSLGAYEMPRREFLFRLAEALRHPTREGSWDEPEGDAPTSG